MDSQQVTLRCDKILADRSKYREILEIMAEGFHRAQLTRLAQQGYTYDGMFNEGLRTSPEMCEYERLPEVYKKTYKNIALGVLQVFTNLSIDLSMSVSELNINETLDEMGTPPANSIIEQLNSHGKK